MTTTTTGNIVATGGHHQTIATNFSEFQAGIQLYTNPAERDMAEWLWGYYVNVLNKSGAALKSESGLTGEELNALFRTALDGFTEEAKEDIFRAISALRNRAARHLPLIRTTVTQRILDCLDYCRDHQTMTYICGPTGRGKTYTAEYWAEKNNHGRTHMVRVPSCCPRGMLVKMIAEAFGVSRTGSVGDREQMLFRAVNRRHVLIIDEAGHLLNQAGSKSPIEFLRDLHDITGCGVAMIFTDVYLPEFVTGKNSAYLEQFIGRIEYPVEIPRVVRKDEVKSIVRAFVPDAGPEFMRLAAAEAKGRKGRLRALFRDLTTAKEFAESRGEQLSFVHFQMAVKLREEKGAFPEDY